MEGLMPVTKAQRKEIWGMMLEHQRRHNRYCNQGRCESVILQEYYICLGMAAVAEKLNLFPMVDLLKYKNALYKPYEK